MARDYRWVKKNPKIDIYRTAMQDRGISVKALALASTVSEQTINNHLFKDTKNPNSFTFILIFEALGIGEKAYYLDTGKAVVPDKDERVSKGLLKAWGVKRAKPDKPRHFKLTPPKKRKGDKFKVQKDNIVNFARVKAA